MEMGNLLGTAQLLSMLLGFVFPVLNGLLTKPAAAKVRVFGQLVLSAAAGFAAEWLDAANTGTAYNAVQAATGWLLTLLTALAVEAKIWAPLGVSTWATTHGVGAGLRPASRAADGSHTITSLPK
ncbi:hypothetical protein BBK82_03430 [Lentzea guizhouensis]|uniref:Holin n=1 Tax=Lentzea guizhouensis TaxID=1586287 RepID=A0A1B2HC20_9PSEU|nr:hypothetical protein [Lentzea guizhouensis]ANZ35267.1 hypothetical protein BBK82_03430 [Lentzea guizhouensis]